MAEGSEVIAPAASIAVPAWSRPFSFLARRAKGWNFLLFIVLLPISIAAVASPPAILYEVCENPFTGTRGTVRCLEANNLLLGLLEALSSLFILIAFMVLACGFAWSGHRRRSRHLRRAYEARIQSVRDHVINGSASPEDFDQVQRLWKPLVRGEHPAVRARAGTAASIIFNVLVSLAFGIGLTVYLIGLAVIAFDEHAGDANEFLLLWNGIFLPILAMHAASMVWGWLRFPRAHTEAVLATQDAVDEAERSEVRLFAPPAASLRRPRVPMAAGPTFAAYSERSRTPRQ